jgi:hypothetical protein
LKLFLALLLASFGSSVLTEKEEENKIGEAIDRIQRFFHFLIEFISRLFRRKKQRQKDIFIENNINETVVYNQVGEIIYLLLNLI